MMSEVFEELTNLEIERDVLQQRIRELEAENDALEFYHDENLVAVVKLENLVLELAAEVENYIEWEYPPEVRAYPDMKRKYDRDMEQVIKARKMVGGQGNEDS